MSSKKKNLYSLILLLILAFDLSIIIFVIHVIRKFIQ
jgi:hypothetical protein